MKNNGARKLSDFPEYVAAEAASDEAQAAVGKNLAEQEQLRTELHNSRRDRVVIDAKPIVDEIARLERQETVLQARLNTARRNLHNIIGQVSAQICASCRGDFAALIEKNLQALKQVCEANEALYRLRDELERGGIETGTLAPATFSGCGRWDDPHGSRVSIYRRHISENYPEAKG